MPYHFVCDNPSLTRLRCFSARPRISVTSWSYVSRSWSVTKECVPASSFQYTRVGSLPDLVWGASSSLRVLFADSMSEWKPVMISRSLSNVPMYVHIVKAGLQLVNVFFIHLGTV